MGYCSGMAFRRVGRVFGVVIGVGFMGAQAAAASGYIAIDWEKVKDDAIKPFDTVSAYEFHITIEMTMNVPSGPMTFLQIMFIFTDRRWKDR